jgi:hypothetical protein
LGAQVGQLRLRMGRDAVANRNTEGACTNGVRESRRGGKAVGEGRREDVGQRAERGPRIEPYPDRRAITDGFLLNVFLSSFFCISAVIM